MTAVVKQVIVVRSDLGLRKGQLMAQTAHASMAWLTERIRNWRWEDWSGGSGESSVMTDEEDRWIFGAFTKIVLSVGSKEELISIRDAAVEAGLTCHLIEESTLDGEPTAVGIGPHEAERIDTITQHLKPYS